MTEPLLVSVKVAARELGIGRDSTYSLIRTGRLHALSIGRKLLVPRTELVSFVAREINGGGGDGSKHSASEEQSPEAAH